ncbi:hypothetical protein LTR56_001619 [Elasticomyces elasticus]|nr:hypothetical protein LTR56_001619 [Elasticomyces elasticus]KAK3667329.1 hypothetical protein LTR22_001845 [Elasticomyces elasticus]KAK4932591.1 hypothetical protein LTR49_001015 [Elasticomyces elasticus]KAK5769613.1 hypothetical protein LTS12_000063 [Elasticomyces elasticus]
MAGRLNYRQRQALKSQGRCFKCRQKGHVANKCGKPSRNSAAHITNLPTELIETIVERLVYIGHGMNFIQDMFDFRLTCKAINDKTYEFFAKQAFRNMSVHIDYPGLQRFGKVSCNPTFANKVERVSIWHRDRECEDHETYETLRETAEDESAEEDERNEAEAHIELAMAEQEQRSFVERSATDGIMLTLAFQRMPNIRRIYIRNVRLRPKRQQSIRRFETGTGESATHIWSTVTSSLAHAGLKAREIITDWYGHSESEEGVSLHALAMPVNLLCSFSELRHLDIRLETTDLQSYKHAKRWPSYLAAFLTAASQLEHLRLGFRNDWKDTAALFKVVANSVKLPCLTLFALNYVRCEGHDLHRFLEQHSGLQSLALGCLDLTGHVGIRDIMSLLEQEFTTLTSFECDKIAQEGWRVCFDTLGEIEVHDPWLINPISGVEDDDFVHVEGPRKYCGRAEDWEGVPLKLAMLRADLQVSLMTYHSDWPDIGYYWVV